MQPKAAGRSIARAGGISWSREIGPAAGLKQAQAAAGHRLAAVMWNKMPVMNTFFVKITNTLAGSAEKDCDA
ncbi:hypothetical protein [Kumtagia ephedrae]|uniref:Uncharacterized protein n=1 Tax=Kumtagia ephedrae TaxID=2116701 RepID=A0A2P7ST58_9HYPH|nr:hypothetical protein [Mesorhizobium ephedrae]PSJ65678.1 hypothetical protein C7I84_00705 [Mesorhizobium ephedrae]